MEEFYAEKRPDQICILEMKLKFTFGGLIGEFRGKEESSQETSAAIKVRWDEGLNQGSGPGDGEETDSRMRKLIQMNESW